MPDIDKAADVRESPCPRCGGEAASRLLEPEGDVEVFCPNCGRFQMPQDEFDQAVSDIFEGEDRGWVLRLKARSESVRRYEV